MGKNLKGKECGKGICQRKDGLYFARFYAKNGTRQNGYFKTLPEAKKWLADPFDDECGHELVFILSQEEVHYVIHAISEKLDNIVCEGGTPFGEDENEEGIVSLSPVNTEEELDMLLAHVLGDDGGGADD